MANSITIKENELRERIIESLNDSYEAINDFNKSYELSLARFKEKYAYYRNKIQVESTLDLLKNMEIELEFVENDIQRDIWKYLKIHTSSIRTGKTIGRSVKILVKNKTTDKYIGILCIGDDLLMINERDTYLKWRTKNGDKYIRTLTNDEIASKIKYVMNIKCCVGMQPLSYNMNIGKLLASLCFSREVQEYFYKKYDNYIAAFSTMSIYGKSIQYKQLPYLKFAGYTKGKSPVMPEDLFKDCIKFLREYRGIDFDKYNNHGYRMKKIQRILTEFGFKINAFDHNIERGIYFGFTNDDAKKFLADPTIEEFKFDINKIQSVKEIVEWWKKRWAFSRLESRIDRNLLKTEIELYGLSRKDKLIEYKKNSRASIKSIIGEEEYRDTDNYNKRLQYNKEKLNYESEYVPIKLDGQQLDKSYVAGLFDTSGIMTVIKYNDVYQLSLYIETECKKIVDLLYSTYGGNAYIKEGKYIYVILEDDANELLSDLKDNIVLKGNLIARLIEYSDNPTIQLYKEINKMFDGNKYDNVKYDRINIPYIAGIFDCKSNYTISKKGGDRYNYFCIEIKSFDDEFTKRMNDIFGTGCEHKGYIMITNKRVHEKLRDMLKYTINKRDILSILIDYVENMSKNGNKYSKDIHEYREKLYNTFVQLK